MSNIHSNQQHLQAFRQYCSKVSAKIMVVAGEMLHDYSDDEICSDIGRSSGPCGVGRVLNGFCVVQVCQSPRMQIVQILRIWVAIVDRFLLFTDMCSSDDLGIAGGPGLTS